MEAGAIRPYSFSQQTLSPSASTPNSIRDVRHGLSLSHSLCVLLSLYIFLYVSLFISLSLHLPISLTQTLSHTERRRDRDSQNGTLRRDEEVQGQREIDGCRGQYR